MKLSISSKQLREALDVWLYDRLIKYGNEWRVRSVQIKKPRSKHRIVLFLHLPKPKPKVKPMAEVQPTQKATT